MKFKLALAQFAPRLGDVDANLKVILDLTAQARAQRAVMDAQPLLLDNVWPQLEPLLGKPR